MASDQPNDILGQYCNIVNKLKKRFLRKPNVTEACESFIALGQRCETSELPAYAGLCWIAAARCESSLGNIPGETSCLIRSARQFFTAEEHNYKLGCPSPSGENLQAALGCYAHAATKFTEKSLINIGLNLEIVNFLKKIQRDDLIDNYLNIAISLSEDTIDAKIYCLGLLASNFIEGDYWSQCPTSGCSTLHVTGDYTAALDTFTEITDAIETLPINGSRSEVLLRCEISRVLLLLILRPSPQKLSPNLVKLLEKYTWGDRSGKTLKVCGMSEEMFLLLQSLVTSCQSSEASCLVQLEADFWPYFTNEERSLLRILVKTHC